MAKLTTADIRRMRDLLDGANVPQKNRYVLEHYHDYVTLQQKLDRAMMIMEGMLTDKNGAYEDAMEFLERNR